MQYETLDVLGLIVSPPYLKKIIPSSGFYRNRECLMLSFRILVKSGDKENKSYFVRLFNQPAEKAANILKNGMQIRVNGVTYQKKYRDKQDVERVANIINANGIWVDILSTALESSQ